MPRCGFSEQPDDLSFAVFASFAFLRQGPSLNQMHDVIVIGGGVNGLITAAFLAKAGLKTLVLERSDRVGGCARTSEIAPGFRCPTLAHAAAVAPSIVHALELERHGLRIVRPEADACAPTDDGRALVLWREAARASDEHPRVLGEGC